MNQFIKALYYDKKDPHIPEEYNFFGVFVGEWDIEWVDHLEVDEPRRVKGEWIFSWVLEGAAIQDVFIVSYYFLSNRSSVVVSESVLRKNR